MIGMGIQNCSAALKSSVSSKHQDLISSNSHKIEIGVKIMYEIPIRQSKQTLKVLFNVFGLCNLLEFFFLKEEFMIYILLFTSLKIINFISDFKMCITF